jgi:hypothetical protein
MSKYQENSFVKFANYENGREMILKGTIEKFIGNGFYKIKVKDRVFTKLENQIRGVVTSKQEA